MGMAGKIIALATRRSFHGSNLSWPSYGKQTMPRLVGSFTVRRPLPMIGGDWAQRLLL
jgi:hypothetical protein